MADATIPVDLRNPGAVFACLGFLEAAEVLCGDAEGGFDWLDARDPLATFTLSAAGDESPVAAVLAFLAAAEVAPVAPEGWEGKSGKAAPSELVRLPHSLSLNPEENALPVALIVDGVPRVVLGHWAEGFDRNASQFKLYAGNRSAAKVLKTLLNGEISATGRTVKQRGIRQLWQFQRSNLLAAPLDVIIPLSGCFNFDARRGSSAIDTGYSANDVGQSVYGSPVVEALSPWGLQNARPKRLSKLSHQFSVWRTPLPAVMARAAYSSFFPGTSQRTFRFDVAEFGKNNKIVTFASEETTR